MWFCKTAVFLSATMTQNRIDSFFFMHTMVKSVRSDPTCSKLTPKPFLYTCTVTYSTCFTLDYYLSQQYSRMQIMRDSPCFAIFSSIMLVKTPSPHNHDPQAGMEMSL